jgi:hypothetical protein
MRNTGSLSFYYGTCGNKKTTPGMRRPGPSTARKMTVSDSKRPDPVMLSTPLRFNGFQKYLIQDGGEDFLLFEGWRVLGIVQRGLDLSYHIASIGHGKSASLFFAYSVENHR